MSSRPDRAWTGPSFRIFGVPVRVDPTFFLIAGLLGFGVGDLTFLVTWVTVVFVSVLVHELGHAVAFRAYGHEPQVLLQGMGGLTWASGRLTGARDIVVSLAGPLTALVLLGLPAWWLDRSIDGVSSTWDLVVRQVFFVNVVWSGVNLLPVLPLDGGQVSASLLRRALGDAGQRAAHALSMAVAGAAALFAFSLGYPFGAMFAVFFVATNWSGLRRREETIPGQAPLVEGYRALAADDIDAASGVADRVLSWAREPDVVASAVELRAWARYRSEGAAEAAAALEDMPPEVTTNRFLVGCIALEQGRAGEGLGAFAAGFALGHFGPWSAIVAEAVARSGLVEPLCDRLLVTPGAGPEALGHLQAHLHAAGREREAAIVGERIP
ncbi:MAG TPA: M50 family metallopeptidase [Acidimicrobiales bacterium]|nr:M50 family metallopeptidase [Acidimicrobiales bacterium]